MAARSRRATALASFRALRYAALVDKFESEPDQDRLAEVAARYAVGVTPHLERLIDPTDPHDPIARQFRPSIEELDQAPEEKLDPIDDAPHSPVEGIVHRYADRCLLKLTHVCPIYCRFCFRREMVGPGRTAPLRPEALEAAFQYIARTPALWEVILTGGDPFMLSARRVEAVTERLAAIEHVQVIRWHTRMPVADPERVSADYATALRCGKAVYVVVHANHPREIGAEAKAALGRLVDAGIPVLAQTVLLKGVNDDPDTLEALMRALVAARVKPYYLHHGDLAPGTGHFRTSIREGQALIETLRARASGLCLPTYVLDVPGGACKAPLAPASVRWRAMESDAICEVRDAEGLWRAYPDKASD